MSRRTFDDEEDDEEFESADGVWDEDFDEDEDTMPCPYCDRGIPEDANRCPYCENYLSDIDAPRPKKPLWFIIGFVAALFVVYRMIKWR